jgi:hypothetical protein
VRNDGLQQGQERIHVKNNYWQLKATKDILFLDLWEFINRPKIFLFFWSM